MQRLIERKQRKDMRNEIEARQTLPGMGGRSFQQSMRYDPTMRSSTSILSAENQKGMGLMENDNTRPFGIRPDMVKAGT